MSTLFDALAFSGAWVAIAAAALASASAVALGASWSPALPLFAFAGTYCVYAVDRLRDLGRDRHTLPRRSAFIARHRRVLAAGCVAAALTAAGCALALGPGAFAAAGVAGGFGLLHRRLKHVPFLKGLYVTASWVVVTIALPASLARPRPLPAIVAWAIAIIGPALLANALATSARDEEAAARVLGARTAVRVARGIGAAGVLAALLAPPPARALGAVAVATVVALVAFRPGERAELILDGALTIGALWVLL
ncbi:hypothetical protein KF840_19190 [bacterium]|nr:hypothetical protein [bacterium]